jgi:hypothetical protein
VTVQDLLETHPHPISSDRKAPARHSYAALRTAFPQALVEQEVEKTSRGSCARSR